MPERAGIPRRKHSFGDTPIATTRSLCLVCKLPARGHSSDASWRRIGIFRAWLAWQTCNGYCVLTKNIMRHTLERTCVAEFCYRSVRIFFRKIISKLKFVILSGVHCDAGAMNGVEGSLVVHEILRLRKISASLRFCYAQNDRLNKFRSE
jgi:hypothetical protein